MTVRIRSFSRGFTLTELAIVFAIVALLLAGAMYTLSAQTEQRNFLETRNRLDQARDLVLAFAIVNGRLPCPARSANVVAGGTTIVTGNEVRNAATGACTDDSAVSDYYGGTNAGVTLGLLPASTIGFQQVDSQGFAVDAWNNRIHYAIAGQVTNCTSTPTPAPSVNPQPYLTSLSNLKTNGISCQPNDLLVCKSATGITASTCGGAANQIMSQDLVTAIIFSTGKNGATTTPGADEAANLNGDPIFVWHTPTQSTAANGEFDDQFTWITVGELYRRLIAAGQLP